ncbi:hypothetical protein PS645_05383 [Pseudomonas fluorescens]|uniref:Uncharacterized protein n=1 Tax=Pseudomonas fluorescens TaxID=294 RepID=A0A5E6XJG0_PSEFL|nr:hypothetical protein PS645_04160 [Pseudomonas fluorescens]VVN40619.1 hypothetical protein PS645_05383 [Pseudomonas fluorescens]
MMCRIGSAPSNMAVASTPTTSASHRAWRTIGPISLWVPAPKRWATFGVVASSVPVINRNTGTQIELPRATAARSRGPTRPAITASTKPIAVVASCATMIGSARPSRFFSSRRTRAGRVRGAASERSVTEFKGRASRKIYAQRRRILRLDASVRKRPVLAICNHLRTCLDPCGEGTCPRRAAKQSPPMRATRFQ